jgi:ribosomal protein L37AE/L43A
VVAIDPAMTSGADSDHTGIIAAGIDQNGKGYVLADESCRVSPKEWATIAIKLLKRFNGDRIIGETNNGGDMIEDTLRSVDDTIPFRKVVASRGKFIRAEPISSLYEQNKVSHIGVFEDLEDEMVTFTVDNVAQNSPDRTDSLVYAMTDLFSGAMTFGALAYVNSQVEASKVERIGKVMTSQLIKPVTVDATTGCPVCESKAVIKMQGQYHCNQCGHSWGGQMGMPMKLATRDDFIKGLL